MAKRRIKMHVCASKGVDSERGRGQSEMGVGHVSVLPLPSCLAPAAHRAKSENYALKRDKCFN